jgi:hypothetical protein
MSLAYTIHYGTQVEEHTVNVAVCDFALQKNTFPT